MLETPTPAPSTEMVPAAMPGDFKAPAPLPDQYLEAKPLVHADGPRSQHVVIHGEPVLLHPSWAHTPLAPALVPPSKAQMVASNQRAENEKTGAPCALDLNAVTPEMMESLAPVTRESLMGLLRNTNFRVTWNDPRSPTKTRQHILGMPVGRRVEGEGETHERHKICGLQLGSPYNLNGASALALRMAEAPNHQPFVDTMSAGLPWVANALHPSEGRELFNACDVANILANVIEKLPQQPSTAGCDQLDAASTLVQRYFEHMCTASPDTLRPAFNELLRGLVPLVPRDADHVGLAIGILQAGMTKFCGEITKSDNRRRWRMMNAVNLIWAASTFIPFFFGAGAVGFSVVAGGVAYDRYTPVRDYSPMLGRFESELMQVLLGAKVPWLPEQEIGRLFLRVRQGLKAAGLPA